MSPVSQLATFRQTVETALQSAWVAAGYDSTALTFANVATDPTGFPLWARATIRFADSGGELTMGNAGVGANELRGVVLVQLFAPVATGTGAILAAVDVIRDVLNRATFAPARCGVPTLTEPQEDPETPSWVMALVSVGFSYIDAL